MIAESLQVEFYRRGWPERFAKFNEADHPRDDDGKFGEGGGGSVDKTVKTILGKGPGTNQPRAKAGGETGPNGEWYPGGAFIATSDLPKKERRKLEKLANKAKKTEVAPYRWEVLEPGQIALMDVWKDIWNHRKGELHEGSIRYYKVSEEQAKEVTKAAKAYFADSTDIRNPHETSGNINDYPSSAGVRDIVKAVVGGHPVSGELLGRLKEIRPDVFDSLKTHMGPAFDDTAEQFSRAFAARGWPEKYREATPKKKGEWVRLGGGGPAYVGSGGQILKACPGMKGETVKGITSESDESRGQRKARQDVADQHGVKGDEVTAEQARGLTQEHKEEAAPWDQPEQQQPKKASINPKTRFGAAVLETAQEWGVAPDDLADACQFVYEEKARQSQARESAKSHARQVTGLTQRDIGRLTNAGYDYTSARNVGGPTGDKLRQFDVWAQEVARQHPGLIGNADDPNADLGAGLWDLLAEGRQVVPPIYDPGVMREAATLALANRGDTGGAYEFEEAGAVPFARRGMVERYRRWMFARENQYRRVSDHYSKRSEPMQEQSYPPINPVEVEHYDKKRSKDHEVSPDIKAQIRELTEAEEELFSGVNKSDAPSRKKYKADQPSEDIDPAKAKKILEDGEVHDKPLTEKQEGLFGAAAGKEED